MIENTLENKAKFLSIYLGQTIRYPNVEGSKIEKCKLVSVGFEGIDANYPRKRDGCVGDYLSWKSNGNHNSNAIHAYLELKSLSSITDEDAQTVAELFHQADMQLSPHDLAQCDIETVKDTIEDLTLITPIADFLRSRGYALSWMGVSVETLVEWNWTKLKED